MTKASAKQKVKMADEDGFFRGEVLELLFEEEYEENMDNIFDPSFEEAITEVSVFLFIH